MARKKTFRAGLCVFLSLVLFFIGAAGGAYFGLAGLGQESDPLPASGELDIHFLELGTIKTGDCTYIKAGDNDILIDAGAEVESIPAIRNYLDQYVTDGCLEYVIVTHAHEDHYAGFATNAGTESLFDIYECEVIIDFAETNKAETEKMYGNYLRERAEEIAAGAKHHTARQCIEEEKNVFDLGAGISLEILDSYFYYNKDTSGENNHSVCCMINQDDRHYLFTGDLEKKGEEYLVQYNDLPEVDVYKAGHHGSKTSSHNVLLDVIKPDIVCVCCCAGSNEYTSASANTFPTQDFVDRIAPHTSRVYVTTLCLDWESRSYGSMNGNIVVKGKKNAIEVVCSNNNTVLKDTAWFRDNRETPDAWVA